MCLLAGWRAPRASLSRSLGTACCVVVSLLGTLLAGRYWKEGGNGKEEDRGGEDFKWTKGKMEQTWFELRVGSFVVGEV